MFKVKLPAGTGTDPLTITGSGIKSYPNPFTSRVTVAFSLDQASTGDLSVYDITGKQVSVIRRGIFNSGENTVTWAGMDDNNNPLPRGMYIIRLVTERSVTSVRVQKI